MYDTGDRDITETKIWIFCPSRTFWKICPKIIQILWSHFCPVIYSRYVSTPTPQGVFGTFPYLTKVVLYNYTFVW